MHESIHVERFDRLKSACPCAHDPVLAARDKAVRCGGDSEDGTIVRRVHVGVDLLLWVEKEEASALGPHHHGTIAHRLLE
jgi:hypothetical protein